MKQKLFTFSKQFSSSYDKNSQCATHLTWKDYFKHQMLKKGYVVKDIREIETITYTCFAAKACIPFKEREEMQKKIDTQKKLSTI